MSDIVAEGLTISVRKREDQGAYEYGVWQDGAWVTIAGRKTGGVDQAIQEAKDAAAHAAAEAAAQPAPPPPAPEPTV